MDLSKRLTHTVTHTPKRADGSSGNMGAEEYLVPSGNDQKRLEIDNFRTFLLFDVRLAVQHTGDGCYGNVCIASNILNCDHINTHVLQISSFSPFFVTIINAGRRESQWIFWNLRLKI